MTPPGDQSKQLRAYPCADSAVVFKTRELFGGLSNMASGFPLQVNGMLIHSSEALYQACRFPHLPEAQRDIIEQKNPMTAKMKSKKYRPDTRADWIGVRVNVMRWCLRVKLAHHWDAFGNTLLETGDMPIVERSRKDEFWGAKLSDDGTLTGCNVLGRLLMELRKEVRESEHRDFSRVPPPQNISDFLLCRQDIDTVTVPEVPVASGPSPAYRRAGINGAIGAKAPFLSLGSREK